MNLNQITIHCSNTIETVEFFQKLGLLLIVDSLPRYARLVCLDGQSTLSVNLDEHAIVSNNIVLYFECSDVDAEYERLTALGIDFTEPPTDRSWLWRQCYLTDPSGNKICLFTAGDNRLNPPWRIN
jgi:Predicted enzyme related to lactoylglutathione lyase